VNLHRNSMMSMDMLRVSDLKQREEKRVSNKPFLHLIKNILSATISDSVEAERRPRDEQRGGMRGDSHLFRQGYFLTWRRTLSAVFADNAHGHYR
jgi:hypothetical protein